jgi:hypothetical protein
LIRNKSLEKALMNLGYQIVPFSVKLKIQDPKPKTQVGTFSVQCLEEYLRILRKGTIVCFVFEYVFLF